MGKEQPSSLSNGVLIFIPPLDLHILHCHSCDLKCPQFYGTQCGSGRTERISLTLDLNGQVTSLLWDSVPSFIK